MGQVDELGAAGDRARLTVSARSTEDGAQIVCAAGELDLEGGAVLEPVLDRALSADPAPRLVAVDATGVTFCDSSGLNLLLRIRQEAEERSVPLHLAGLTDPVLRVLEITGADSLFSIHAQLDQALA
ncbi:putative anti-sigma factor antagonist [Actinacidiphila reveromycinica]|uniref:Putative anti-sigma factor antagonist n=1 Tax=Actinacidiphila reveromycinica TaxID=659352 RepID=A0A7U3V0G3_9ACTN|nr:STAS domain-containing protein [Streptomyces sp. SN-593]BBB01959.1 putative anti-sigma factor antagonist [Streptomyces sp. SN-593]